MPIFEFECPACLHQFEFLQRSAAPQAACPVCGHADPRKLISLCGVSSDTSQAANLAAAHQQAAKRRTEKQRAAHEEHHHHFGDH